MMVLVLVVVMEFLNKRCWMNLKVISTINCRDGFYNDNNKEKSKLHRNANPHPFLLSNHLHNPRFDVHVPSRRGGRSSSSSSWWRPIVAPTTRSSHGGGRCCSRMQIQQRRTALVGPQDALQVCCSGSGGKDGIDRHGYCEVTIIVLEVTVTIFLTGQRVVISSRTIAPSSPRTWRSFWGGHFPTLPSTMSIQRNGFWARVGVVGVWEKIGRVGPLVMRVAEGGEWGCPLTAAVSLTLGSVGEGCVPRVRDISKTSNL